MKTIEIDLEKTVGKIKAMNGVNNGPIPKSAFRGLDNFDSFKALKIPVIRNHDASFCSAYGGEHTVDVDNIFPDFSADETDPASYDFKLTDYYTKSCCDTGAAILYRFGSKIEHEPKKYHTNVPKDFLKWAKVCEHIILHLCYGWADGLHLNIPLWEIWNEADGFNIGAEDWNRGEPHNACWQGSFEEFLEFYKVVAVHLKNRFPELLIGGPAFTTSYKGYGYFEKFARFMAENKVPLDFYSWHRYDTDPHHFGQDGFEVREVLDALGYTDTKLVLDEWNYVKEWRGEEHKKSLKAMQTEKGAAFNGACIIAMQHSPMDIATYYDARVYCEFNGLFEAYTQDPLKGYHVFSQFSRLAELENEAESLCDDRDIYVCAAAGKQKAAVQIVCYNDEVFEDGEALVRFRGLKENTVVYVYLMDKDHDNDLVRTERPGSGEAGICLNIRNNISYLLELRQEP